MTSQLAAQLDDLRDSLAAVQQQAQVDNAALQGLLKTNKQQG